MTLSKTEKILVWLLVIVAVLAIGYYIFSGSSGAPAPTDTTATPAVGQDILALVEKLKVISIDPSVFSSPLFSGLKDSETPLSAELQGRADPFSALGVDAPFTTTVAGATGSGGAAAQTGPQTLGPTINTTATSTSGM